MLKIKDMTPRYRCEYYKDDYNSYQAIMIDLEKEQRSDGKYTMILRSHINPNLKHHYKNIILNKEQQIINEYNFDD